VSDIVMAGAIDGLGLAKIIRERKPSVPVLLVTGFSQVLAEPEFTVMRKPFDLPTLSRTVSRMIAREAALELERCAAAQCQGPHKE
jgi:DNA-binding NtrC family response regulator